MRLYKGVWIGAILLLTLSGCWDEKDVGEVNFATAIGIDYVDENYILYVQMMDFANVAKKEGGKQSEDVSLFIGKSLGSTLNEAVTNLYHTSQESINWGQVGAIIYSESVLKKGIETFEQAINRNGEFRYTPWMFATKEPVEEILGVSGFFKLPPLYTILYKPENGYRVHSFIKPIRMHKFVSIYKEPGSTAVLPSISLDYDSWKEISTKEDPKKTLKINGGFPIVQEKFTKWMSLEELKGLRWIESDTENTPVKIIEDEKVIGMVEISRPSTNIKQIEEGRSAKFNIELKATGQLTDLKESRSLEEIEQLINHQIEEEIRKTYQIGLDNNTDIYSLRRILFRNGMKLENVKDFQLTEETLNEISTTFHLESKGIYD
ncbi:Ger(x)C family spore germination protein [Ornithinibacillus salinisoli]|uniref:Ger(X)C family spore germination protein n=1 Tax=Ornithinibacillus salinisoli TaxID=1848459 RepID=A0ABW4W804_9BACI